MPKHHSQGMRMIANTQWDLSGNKIKPAPPLHYRVVACPVCKAEVGAPCISETGREKSQGHVPRRRLAIRKLLDEREIT